MPGVNVEEVFRILQGESINVLDQFRRGRKDVTEIAEELDISEQKVVDHYRILEDGGYLKKQDETISSSQLTHRAADLFKIYSNLRSGDLPELYDQLEAGEEQPLQDHEEVLEVKTVNQRTVVYENGYVWKGDPSEYEMQPGDHTQISKTGEKSISLGMEKVEIVEHIGKLT